MKPHRTDPLSLFFGVTFLLVAAGFLTGTYLDVGLPAMGWFVAAGLIFFGIVAAVGALRPPRAEPAKATEDDSPERHMLAE